MTNYKNFDFDDEIITELRAVKERFIAAADGDMDRLISAIKASETVSASKGVNVISVLPTAPLASFDMREVRFSH